MDNSNSKNLLPRDKIAQVFLGEWGSDAFQQRTRDRVNWFVDQINHGTVFDIGCSEGILPILLGRKGIDVIGVDINPESIEYANNLLLKEESTVANHVTFICDDFITSDWSDKTYDTVIIGEIIEHFENPEVLINKAIQQLKPGALLLVTTPLGYFPDPDHRFTFTLTSFLEFFRKDSIMPLSLTVVDGYIRFSAQSFPAKLGQWDAIIEKLLPISEEAILNIQRLFHNQINDMVKLRQELYATIRQLREQINNDAKEINYLRKSIISLENGKQKLENEKQQQEHQLIKLQSDYLTMETKIQSLQADHQELLQINEKFNEKIEYYSTQINEIQGALSYQLSREIALAFKPFRFDSLLLPVRISRLVLIWIKQNNKI